MKVELINKAGGKMLVDESRVAEYLEAGHKPASKAVTEDAPVIKKTSKKKKEG